ncbi:PIN domain-containing protein [Streptomyces sp. RLA2-12]|uniref:PIN domain-containing protein n=1 Tax=Streptomyces sp. RLA2-12 TaxID=2721242 RepID=UPI00145CC32C|nr:PIN domain-containing protein [Streptomyces sp. RLA2-12]NMI63177.1 hypothetical protein [Streptomyces sp. RLA2-12]
MLVTPRPGVNRDHLLRELQTVHVGAMGLMANAPAASARERVADYMAWAVRSARRLRRLINAADVERLILTPRYMLVVGVNGAAIAGDLIAVEVEERAEELEAAILALQTRIARWSGPSTFVVADSSFYIEHADKLENLNFRSILGPAESEKVHLLFPMMVVDELDRIKEHRDGQKRWRAGYTLAFLEGKLTADGTGILRRSTLGENDSELGEITAEILFDPPNHIRMPIADDEIIDRALAVQALAPAPVMLVTYDTGQSTRGRLAGLSVKKLRKPKPDNEAASK